MNQTTKPVATKKPGKPKPGVEKGDEVYFKSGDQHTHGRVASHGAHGCHIDHEGGRSRVYWEDILGHKSRSAKSAKVVNQGDDGFLMEDDHGRRRFVAGEPPKPDETADDHDAVLEHARRATPLAKALGQLDELVKAHVSAYTKKDGTFVAAHDDKRVKRAPGSASGQQSLLDQPAKKPHVTETPAFKKWFGDSKVVDASGKPLVVYHGTRHSFDEFMREGRKGRDRLHYFTVDPAIASEYAGGVQYGTPNVMPAYVSLKKPFTFDAAGDQWGSLPLDIFPDEISQHFDERNILRGRPGQIPRIGFTEVIRGALAAGYDGVVADNITDGGGEYGESHPSKVIVAHAPEQIKSAIGNNGNFDPENPNMTKSISDEPRVLFFKGGPLANRPGLMQKKITDKTGRQTTRWVRTNHDAPANDNGGGDPGDKRGAAAGYGTHDIQPGSRVKFKAGEHEGEGEVTAVGEHGVTAKDATGREHQILHHEVTHFKAGEGVKKPDVQNTVLGEQKPIPAAQFGAADYAKSHDQADVSPESVLSNFPPDTGDRIKAAQDRLAGIEQTIEQFKKDGKWAAQREVLHHKIMSELLSPERVQAATPAEGEKPRFVILGGRGGSGKSSFAGAVYDPAKCIVLDADHIKGMIPEYEGWNASAVHEESGEIFDNAVRLCRELGLNTVLDKTMKTAKSAIADVQAFKDAGYRTEAHYMHLPRQEAAKRAVGRFLGGGEKGRYVPVEVVLSNTTNEAAFDQVKGMVDAWSFRDNNVPKGSKPILISQSGGEAAAGDGDKGSEKEGTVKLFRGSGVGSSESGDIVWMSSNKEIASGYANARKDGKVHEVAYSKGNVFDAGRDANEMTPSQFAARALNQAAKMGKVDGKTALDAKKEFLASHGSDSMKITDFWRDDDAKKKSAEFLKKLGFQTIQLDEDGVETYGALGFNPGSGQNPPPAPANENEPKSGGQAASDPNLHKSLAADRMILLFRRKE